MKKAVAYYRVSRKRQGESGLGLEAQKEDITHFIHMNGYILSSEYVEVESGRKNNRPVLQLALASCKKHKATLLIARLDRLARNVAFISNLMESGVDFKAVDNPKADKFLMHIKAVVAEHERDQISVRTKAALQAAKKRGTILGSYGKNVLSKVNKRKATCFALKLAPTISHLQSCGFISIRDITAELNRMKIPTPNGKGHKWHVSSVHRLLQRLKEINENNNT